MTRYVAEETFGKDIAQNTFGKDQLFRRPAPGNTGSDCADWQDFDFSAGDGYIQCPQDVGFGDYRCLQYANDCNGDLIIRGSLAINPLGSASWNDIRKIGEISAPYTPAVNEFFVIPVQMSDPSPFSSDWFWMDGIVQFYSDGTVYFKWPATWVPSITQAYTIFGDAVSLTTGDGQFPIYVPPQQNGRYWQVYGWCSLAGAAGDTTIQLRNNGVDLLSTKITIPVSSVWGQGIFTSQPVTLSDWTKPVYVDIDSVSVGAKGLGIALEFGPNDLFP